MRLGVLLRESASSARAQKVPTALVAILVAAMCLTTMLTVGRAAAAQAQVQDRLEEAGSRRLQITDARAQDFLTPSVVDLVATMSTVERVIGLSVPVDVSNARVGPGGARVPAWTLTGDLADAVELTSGRWPGPGEALVSAAVLDGLGMDTAIGAIATSTSAPTAVVGAFRARDPYTDLDAGAVVSAPPDTSAHTLDIVLGNAQDAAIAQQAVLALLARPDPADLTIRSPRTLAEVQDAVIGDLARYNRGLMLVVMAMGALLVAVVALSDVLMHRRDLGRRRALGAPRWVITTLVVVRTVIGATLGAVIGTAVGLVITNRSGQTPEAGFVAGTAILAVLTAAAATIPPAAVAARQDPVRVLRTP